MANKTEITSDPMNARSLPNGDGFAEDLERRLGDMLRQLEELYGPRHLSYTILGIEFDKSGPYIFYPGTPSHVIVQLNTDALNNLERACYQLAQEAIHLLSPTGRPDANVLEEGLGVHFAADYMLQEFGSTSWRPHLPAYRRAGELTERILDCGADVIKRLREIQPTISLISADQMLEICPSIDSELSDSLTQRFDRDVQY